MVEVVIEVGIMLVYNVLDGFEGYFDVEGY